MKEHRKREVNLFLKGIKNQRIKEIKKLIKLVPHGIKKIHRK